MESEPSQKNLQEEDNVPVKATKLGDKEKMKSIPKQQRNAYIKRMLKVQQLPGPPPYSFKKPYLRQGKFKYKDFNLHYYANQSNLRPKAILVSFHGMGGHSLFGGYLANTIFQEVEEINVYSLDQINFGKSQGPYRGLISSLDENVQQSEAFLDFIMSKLQSKPKVFLCGLSYGGSISFRMAVRAPQRYAGIIFLAPAIRFLHAAFGIMAYVAKCLACCCPPFRMYKDKQFTTVSRYNRNEELLSDEFLYNDGNIPHSYDAAMNAMDEISTEYHLLKSPYILFQGGTDKFVDPFAPLDLEEESPSPDKTTLYSEDMWHSVYSEIEIQEITQVSITWIRERI